MRKVRVPIAVAAVVAAGLAVSGVAGGTTAKRAAACDDTRRIPTAATIDAVREATVCLINVQRAARGLRALRISAPLERAAQRHSEDMVRRDYFSHASGNGDSLGERLRAAGWRDRDGGGWSAGEIIGWGTGTRGDAQSMVAGWMRSTGHRVSILNPRFRQIGVGVAPGVPRRRGRGGTYTADFAGS